MRVFIAMVVFLSVWIVSVGAIDSKYMLSNVGVVFCSGVTL